MTALALTEHGNVSSHVPLERAAQAAGIKPLFGLEAYCATGREGRFKHHLGLIAENAEGYRNLCRLVTQSWEEKYYEPTVSGRNLADHADGLLVLSGCTGSRLATALTGGKGTPDHEPDIPAAMAVAERFHALFGDRYYIEVQAFPELERSSAINPAYERIGKKLGIPLVATCDIHYPRPEDNVMQTILHAARRGSFSVERQSQMWEYDVPMTYPPDDWALFTRLQETGLSKNGAEQAIASTAEIAERCTVTLPKAEPLRYPLPEGWTAESELWDWLNDGMAYRGLRDRESRQRLNVEFRLIQNKGLADFFLATAEVIQWAKDQGIAVGPARGSAAASLACYALRITEINPLKYPQMLLERFLDPSRADMPDIDLDFEDGRRDEIRQHLAEKYGAECVGNIANFTKYRGKLALNDVARVYNISQRDIKTVADLVAVRPDGDERQAMALEDAASFPAARKVFERHPDLQYALRLEGNLRELGTHAAGLVVASQPIGDFCALYKRESGSGDRKREVMVLAADKWGAEYLGALKMDFLGLTAMSMLADACRLAGITIDDLYALQPDDPEVMASFAAANVTGIFQFEGRATATVCEKVKPRTFMELADISALSRPGCMASGTTTAYIKAGRGWVKGAHTPLGKILADTRGEMVYQEQLLAIVRDIGGFDWAGASRVRKIVSKKLGGGQLAKEFQAFSEGAARLHGMREDQARAIWKRMEASASYLFNVAHSVSYAMLAYWSMWMKVYHPAAFFTASLRYAGSGKDDMPRVARLIKGARREGITVEPPELRNAGITWTLDPGDWAHDPRIMPGLSQIPGVGEKTAQAILEWRGSRSEAAWEDVIEVGGIGPVSHAKILKFVQSSDPFGVDTAGDFVGEIREAIKAGQLRMPYPRYGALQVSEASPRSVLTWAGIVRKIEFRDFVEDERARTGETIEQIRARVRDPELQKSVTLKCEDGEGEVWVRFNRWAYPGFSAVISTIVENRDAVVVSGKRTQGMSAAIAAERMWVVEPD